MNVAASCRGLGLALAVGLTLALPAQAFKLTPIEMEFAPSGRGATQTFLVENPNAAPEAIEIRMFSRDMNEAGEDILEEDLDNFVVFPAQIILQPGQEQAVRVQWIGDPAPAEELAYRLIAEQLPIDLGEEQDEGGQMKLLVRYIASVYIVPDGAKPKVALQGAGPAADGSGLELVFTNAGSAHALLTDLTLTVKDGSGQVILGKEELENVSGQNLLAGHTRRFVIPWPAGIAPGAVEVDFSYDGG